MGSRRGTLYAGMTGFFGQRTWVNTLSSTILCLFCANPSPARGMEECGIDRT